MELNHKLDIKYISQNMQSIQSNKPNSLEVLETSFLVLFALNSNSYDSSGQPYHYQ